MAGRISRLPAAQLAPKPRRDRKGLRRGIVADFRFSPCDAASRRTSPIVVSLSYAASPIWRPTSQPVLRRPSMTQAKKSFRLELTKEQQALALQKTGMEAKELELTDGALRIQTEPKRVGNQR